MQKGMPKPRRKREARYMPTVFCVRRQIQGSVGELALPPLEKPCRNAPTIMTQDPKKTHHRRPKRSLMIGMKGSAQMAPRE